MLARCSFAIQDEGGSVVDGARITVRLESSGLLASLFADRDGLVRLPNPYVASDGANAGFFAEGAAYRITATHGGVSQTRTYQAVGTVRETDADFYSGVDYVLTVNGVAPVDSALTLNADDIPYGSSPASDVDAGLDALVTSYGNLLVPSYLTLATSTPLANERVLTAGSGMSFSDAGANSTLTINATAAAQKVLQVLQTTYAANSNNTTTLPLDDTVPTNSEGVEVLSQPITPASSSNKILVSVVLWGATASNNNNVGFAVFRGSTCIDAGGITFSSANFPQHFFSKVLDSPGTTSAVTYTVRVGPGSGSVVTRLNGHTSARFFGGVSKCTLTVKEIAG